MAADGQGRGEFGRRRESPRISITINGRSGDLTVSTGWLVTLALVTVAYIGATGYLLFRDEIVGAVIARQIELRNGYEDRISALRTQIDRIHSRQLLDQEAFEAKIDTLIARQDDLKRHEAEVAALLERARASGVKLPAGSAAAAGPEAPASVGAAPFPALPPAPKEGAFRASSWLDPVIGARRPPPPSRAEARITSAEAAIESYAARQMMAVGALAEFAERDAKRIEKVVGRLGLRLADVRGADKDGPNGRSGVAAVGGPLVPLDPTVLLRRAETAMERLAEVRRSVHLLPLGTPVRGDPQITSTYGNRSDPFLGVLAMHTGIDFRADVGDPVVATGAGTVIEASRQGGYGLMVEIEHGNGVTTRFGHLSRIAVDPGAMVKRGQVIGYAGSTGRSTGPHLHYETRINGDPVNPMGWLDAGEELQPLLR